MGVKIAAITSRCGDPERVRNRLGDKRFHKNAKRVGCQTGEG